MSDHEASPRNFPYSAGIFFGLGLGGFFDGIVLHQILQWHHMLSSVGYPPENLENGRSSANRSRAAPVASPANSMNDEKPGNQAGLFVFPL